MKLQFLGAAGTTTGSKHLLTVNGRRLLLDCGLFQGRRAEAFERNQRFPVQPDSVDAVILSHAHIDHSGLLPVLCKHGFSGNIYSTAATRDLCQIMLADSAKVQQQDSRFVNKRRARQNLPPVFPLYDARDAERCLQQFVTLNYERPLSVADGVTLTFFDAGHILGSAQVCLDIVERGKRCRFLFSGDVGRGNNQILRDPVRVPDVDYLLMESTYGNREHDTEARPLDVLHRALRDALNRGGKILVPAFAVDRAQQIVFSIHQLREADRLPSFPMFVDSPLAVNATEVFRLHPECFNEATYDFLFDHRNPFGFEDLRYIREVSESKALNDLAGPALIISSSGMCEAGRILHHLRNNIEDPAATVLMVGYCAPDTLGAKLRARQPRVNIFGEPFDVRATVVVIDSYSGHADRSELIDYVRATTGTKRQIWLVHGEADQSRALQSALAPAYPESLITVPQEGDSVELVP